MTSFTNYVIVVNLLRCESRDSRKLHKHARVYSPEAATSLITSSGPKEMKGKGEGKEALETDYEAKTSVE